MRQRADASFSFLFSLPPSHAFSLSPFRVHARAASRQINIPLYSGNLRRWDHATYRCRAPQTRWNNSGWVNARTKMAYLKMHPLVCCEKLHTWRNLFALSREWYVDYIYIFVYYCISRDKFNWREANKFSNAINFLEHLSLPIMKKLFII